jgi:hypothetical protein
LAGCLELGAQSLPLISADAAWRWLPGATEPPADWRAVGFEDAAWPSAGQPLHTAASPAGTRLPDFGATPATVYLRHTFTVNQPAKVSELVLNALVDDGFVAWLNGREIIRHNVAEGALTRQSTALETAPEPHSEERFALAQPSSLLVAGENVLALQVLNAPTSGEPDLLWNATLGATLDLVSPTLVTQVPAPGSTVEHLTHIEVVFSEAVVGVDESDLLVNGQPASQVSPLVPGHFRFEFPAVPTGTAQFTFAADHGIHDGLAEPNAFANAFWTVQVNPEATRRQVVISEFMADSYRSLKDEDGDYPDWIELANTGDSVIDLRGWALTDDANDRFKWRFGTHSLPAHGYLVVFASEKNKTNITTRTKLHTNFRLSNNGEYLALVAPDGEVVSAFAPGFPAQRTDISYGRAPDAPELTAYFANPTPGQRNSAAGAGFAPGVSFSAPSGNFLHDFRLHLTPADTNAVIRYTLSGAVPTNGSTLYTGPISITNTTEVRARAFAPDLLPGPVSSEAYIKLSPDPAHQAWFTSTLPILVMSTMRPATITGSRGTPVRFSLHEPVDGIASLRLPPTFTSRGSGKIRGSSSATLPKVPYAIEWWDEFNEDTEHGVLGLPADSEWVLYAPNVYDPVMIHNPFIHQLSRDLGQYSPRTRFVELYVQRATGPLVTNQWMGIYVLEEKPAIGANRLAIDKLQPEDVALPEVTGGYLMKVDRLDPGDGGIVFTGGSVAAVDPKEPELESPQRAPQLAYIKKHLSAFSGALNSVNWRNPETGYLPYLDLTNWIDYHVVEVLSGNVDSLVLSAYFHKERDGRLKWGPHWDFDRALGSTDGRDQNPRTWQTGPFFTATWWSRLFRDPTAWQLWVDRYQEFRADGLSRSNMNRLIDRFSSEVAPSQKREEKKWGVRPRGGSYQAEVNLMKNWLSNRVDFIDRQMTARPSLSSPGGRVLPGFTVTLTKPAGATVYYTLDGTDPRLAFGTNQPAPGTQIYTGPITITGTSRLVARARDLTKRQLNGPPITTPWSGAVVATFTVNDLPLTVTEIMFNPAQNTTPDGPDHDEFEFLELRNTAAHSIALPGYRLQGGVDFSFTTNQALTELAAGQRLLLVANRAAFQSRYPGIGPIAGEYTRRLKNSGDRLTLSGPLQEPGFDFEFQDRWQLLADGTGFSLTRVGEGGPASTQPNLATAWRLSGRLGGSPGEADPEPAVPTALHSALRISEIFPGAGKLNFVELEARSGPTAQPLDVSGWWLTNERDDWRKFRLPLGSILKPDAANNARLVVSESQFNLPNGGGFKLDPRGGEVWLLSANQDGDLTGFITGGVYGPTELGHSLVADALDFTDSHFRLTANPSPGAVNALAMIGPVSFRTIHFEPPAFGSENNSQDEFIELENTSAAAVPLFAPANPALTWQIRGGVELDFPPSLILPAGGRVVLVSFAPESDQAALTAFLTRHAPRADVTLVGPWRGQLNNAGDSLRLQRPLSTTSAATTEATYVTVEAFTYAPTTPWPTNAAGSGRALVRRDPTALAAEPTAWVDAWPTPGWADTDQDGLPDAWETEHYFDPDNSLGTEGGDADPDQDGFTNRMEFLNGTDPREVSNALRPHVTVSERGNLRFHLAAPAGQVLELQRADSLAPSQWQTVRTFTVGAQDAAGFAFEETDTAGRFYRLMKP